MPPPAAPELQARNAERPQATIAVHELLARSSPPGARQPAVDLIDWLIEGGYAVEVAPGRLASTGAAHALFTGIDST